MIGFVNIKFYEDMNIYNGKNAIVRNYYGITEGKISVNDNRVYFCSNDPHLDGATCPNKFGYEYSWNVSARLLDGVILDDGEKYEIPQLRLSVLKLKGNKLIFKLTDECYNKLLALKGAGDFKLNKNIYIKYERNSGVEFNLINYRCSDTNKTRTVSFANSRDAKVFYRAFLSYYLPKVELEGDKYDVIYPTVATTFSISIKNMDRNYTKDTLIKEYRADKFSELISIIKGKGYLLPVKASTVSEYFNKASKYLFDLCRIFFGIIKDDHGDYILSTTGCWMSDYGTEYVYASNNEKRIWEKKENCIKAFPLGKDEAFCWCVNNSEFLKKHFKSISGCYFPNDRKYSIGDKVMDNSEVSIYCSKDAITRNYFLTEDMIKIGDKYYHPTTLKRTDVFRCDNCGQYYKITESLHQIGNSKLCANCACSSEEKFHSYSYKPKCLFHHIKDENKTNLYLGMELEFGCADTNDIVNLISNYLGEKENIAYMKRDASVQGIELVFQPYTFKSFKEMTNKQLYPLLKLLISKKCKGHNEGGIHIHTSLDAWSPDQLVNLYTFFYSHRNNHKFIKRIAQRTTELDHWASLNNIDVSYRENSIKEKNYRDVSGTRYTALNMTAHTLEFRIFNSSLRYDRILKNAEFVCSLFEFTKTDKPMYVKNYLEWLKENPSEYKELLDFLNETEKE